MPRRSSALTRRSSSQSGMGACMAGLGRQDVPRSEAGAHVRLRQQALQGIQREPGLMQSHRDLTNAHIRSVRAGESSSTRTRLTGPVWPH